MRKRKETQAPKTKKQNKKNTMGKITIVRNQGQCREVIPKIKRVNK